MLKTNLEKFLFILLFFTAIGVVLLGFRVMNVMSSMEIALETTSIIACNTLADSNNTLYPSINYNKMTLDCLENGVVVKSVPLGLG